MSTEELNALNRQVQQIDPNPTRADGYIRNSDLAQRVMTDLLRQPWPGKGLPRLELRWAVEDNWTAIVYDFVENGDPGDGLGVRPFYHTAVRNQHEQLAPALCLAIVSLSKWLSSARA